MLIERVKQLCGGEIPENVNGRFFQIAHGITGYVFVKASVISEDFQDIIDNPGAYDYDDNIGKYEALRGIYIDFNYNIKEITEKNTYYVQLNEEIDDSEGIEEVKSYMNERLDRDIENINKLKSWLK